MADVEIEQISEGAGAQTARNAALRKIRQMARDIVEKKTEVTPGSAGALLELGRQAGVLDEVPREILDTLRLVSGEMSMQSSSEEEAAAKEAEKEAYEQASKDSLKCMLCSKLDRNMVMRCCMGCVVMWERQREENGADLLQLKIICQTCLNKLDKNYQNDLKAARCSKDPPDVVHQRLNDKYTCPRCQGLLRGKVDIFLHEEKQTQAYLTLGWKTCPGCNADMDPSTMGDHVSRCDKIKSGESEEMTNYIKDTKHISARHCKIVWQERQRVEEQRRIHLKRIEQEDAAAHAREVRKTGRSGHRGHLCTYASGKRAREEAAGRKCTAIRRGAKRRRGPRAPPAPSAVFASQ